MRKPYKQLPKSKKIPAIICPDCGSENTMKVHRNILEKILSALTFETLAFNKYYCKVCDRYILKGRSSAQNAERFHDENTRLAGDFKED
jgi:hypothetical protein